jgi:hypothetical protein
MKFIKISLVCELLLSMFLYMAFSFVLLELNPLKWDDFSRQIFALLVTVLIPVISLAISEYISNETNKN